MDNSLNSAVLIGTVGSEPLRRDLAGGHVVQFDLATAESSVPVSWHDPTEADAALVVPGDAVVLVGSVRRRFFRTGGVTQSRTEVIVERLVPLRRTKTARSAVAAAVDQVTRAVA